MENIYHHYTLILPCSPYLTKGLQEQHCQYGFREHLQPSRGHVKYIQELPGLWHPQFVGILKRDVIMFNNKYLVHRCK